MKHGHSHAIRPIRPMIATDVAANCALWLPAHTLSSDGQTWSDLSGNNRHFTQATAGKRPTVGTGPNGYPSVRFDASRVISCAGSVLTGLTAAHFFIVCKFDNAASAANSNGAWMLDSDTANGNYVPFSDGKIYDGMGSTARKTTNVTPNPAMTSWQLYEVVSTVTEWTLFQNGVQKFTTGTNTVGFPATLHIGGNSATPDIFMLGDIEDVFIFPGKLTATERARVTSYVAKYGIAA